MPIEDVTTEAFAQLGDNGLIRAAHEQSYKRTADIIPDINAPRGENNNISVSQALEDREANNMEIDHAPVKMVVLDGIVMRPTHCAFDNCTADLDNYRGGAFWILIMII